LGLKPIHIYVDIQTLPCRELAADERLGKDYWPLYTLMRRAAAAPLLAFPEKDEEAALEVCKT